jgi:hypothetical protein
MNTIYSYACKDYPGMETCLGRFYAETEEEVIQHMELHAPTAHQEGPTQWSAEDWGYLKGLIRAESIDN